MCSPSTRGPAARTRFLQDWIRGRETSARRMGALSRLACRRPVRGTPYRCDRAVGCGAGPCVSPECDRSPSPSTSETCSTSRVRTATRHLEQVLNRRPRMPGPGSPVAPGTGRCRRPGVSGLPGPPPRRRPVRALPVRSPRGGRDLPPDPRLGTPGTRAGARGGEARRSQRRAGRDRSKPPSHGPPAWAPAISDRLGLTGRRDGPARTRRSPPLVTLRFGPDPGHRRWRRHRVPCGLEIIRAALARLMTGPVTADANPDVTVPALTEATRVVRAGSSG